MFSHPLFIHTAGYSYAIRRIGILFPENFTDFSVLSTSPGKTPPVFEGRASAVPISELRFMYINYRLILSLIQEQLVRF